MKKKKGLRKKGFTLVELIAVLVILAIVTLIVSLSINSINQLVRKKQKENMLNSMQVQAKKYVNDTGIKKVYVDTLIKEGYVSADNDKTSSLSIEDPTNPKQYLNCYYYDFTSDANGVLTEPDNLETTDCDANILADVILKIQYSDDGGSTYKDFDDKWIRQDYIILKVVSNNLDIINAADLNSGSSWTTPLAPDVYYSPSGTFEVNTTNGYLNDTYQVTINKEGTSYNASQHVKMDSKKPVITNVRLDKPNEWTTAKYVFAEFEDTGSGMAYFAISSKSNASDLANSDWKTIIGNKHTFSLTSSSLDNKLTENGTYYVYAKDVAGNITRSEAFIVEKIDSIPPTCEYLGESDEWTNQSRTITWGCKDDETGCNPSYSGGTTVYSVSTKLATINQYTIKDNAGNVTTCAKRTDVKVYVDKDKPTISSFTITSNKTYNSIDAKYSISGTDIQAGKSSELASGIDKYCITTSNDSSSCSWVDASSANITLSDTEGSGNSHTRYAFIKDKAGNISNSKNKTYTLYTNCSDVIEDTNYEWSGCSVSCGGGTQTRRTKDRYLGGRCTDTSRSCNTQGCCTSTSINYNACTSWRWSECSKLCGGGTQYEYRYCDIVSNYNGTVCDTYEDTRNSYTSCNTQSCCDEGTWEYDSCSENGYKVYSRYNECTGRWEYDEDYYQACTYDLGCDVEECPTNTINKSVEEMTIYPKCSYYYGGRLYEDYDYDEPYYCDYGDRYLGCDEIYVGRCYGNYGSDLCEVGWNYFGTYYARRDALFVDENYMCSKDYIGGYRYMCTYGEEEVYIFACAGSNSGSPCLYHTIDYDFWSGVDYSIVDTTVRGDLRNGSGSC